jgi:hypothetical protein
LIRLHITYQLKTSKLCCFFPKSASHYWYTFHSTSPIFRKISYRDFEQQVIYILQFGYDIFFLMQWKNLISRHTITFSPSRHYVNYGWFAEASYTYVLVEYISIFCVKAYGKNREIEAQWNCFKSTRTTHHWYFLSLFLSHTQLFQWFNWY